MPDAVADLLAFIDCCPTPYHAVAEASRRLGEAGFRPLAEAELWELSPGDRCYAARHDGSLVAFQLGGVSPAEGGFRVVGAHTDSPNLRVKPLADLEAHGYHQLAVEPYGAALLYSWLDRELSLAGRVTLRGGEALRTVLVDFGRPLLRVPSLAIHLQRELKSEGLRLNAQTHLAPLLGLEGAPDLRDLLARELGAQGIAAVEASDLLGLDLMAYDLQPAALSGAGGEFICASRIDNLGSCHAAVTALASVASAPGSATPAFTRAVVLYDHEEVGSQSARGAAGPLLAEVLERVVAGFQGGEPQGLARALARSLLVSVDMAHAVHPNYADKHEPGHRPVLGGGPVIKLNANQSYASDAYTAGIFSALCGRLGVRPQHFVSRSDLACGSTIGPTTAARVGIRAVDVGSPMLSMHSCREMAGRADVQPMIDVLRLFLETA